MEEGLVGAFDSFISTNLSKRRPFFKLQLVQADTTLFHVVFPFKHLGTRWSKVNSFAEKCSWQYWQVKLSRKKTLKRVKAGLRWGKT